MITAATEEVLRFELALATGCRDGDIFHPSSMETASNNGETCD